MHRIQEPPLDLYNYTHVSAQNELLVSSIRELVSKRHKIHVVDCALHLIANLAVMFGSERYVVFVKTIPGNSDSAEFFISPLSLGG